MTPSARSCASTGPSSSWSARPARRCRSGPVERWDHAYVRNGVASLFLDCEPLAGWRHVAVAEQRRRSDWVTFIRDLLEDRYRQADTVVLVTDHLNIHAASL